MFNPKAPHGLLGAAIDSDGQIVADQTLIADLGAEKTEVNQHIARVKRSESMISSAPPLLKAETMFCLNGTFHLVSHEQRASRLPTSICKTVLAARPKLAFMCREWFDLSRLNNSFESNYSPRGQTPFTNCRSAMTSTCGSPEHPEALMAKVEFLLDDPQHGAEFGLSTRDRSEEKFTHEGIAAHANTLSNNVIHTSRQSRRHSRLN